MKNLYEKTLKTTEIYKGKVFTVTSNDVELIDGYKTKRDVVHHNGGVVIVAEIDNKILMVKQFRYPVGEELYELPAGKLDKQNEDILSAAKRELEEETGYFAAVWESLGFLYTSPGYSSEKLFMFKASNLKFRGQHTDEGEILNSISFDKDEIFSMIKDGRINDAKTISALMRAYKL